MHAAGVTVIIAKFQWVGVMHGAELTTDGSAVHSDHTNTTTATDTATAAAAAADDDDDDDKATSSPRMQYFIKVVLCFILLPGPYWYFM